MLVYWRVVFQFLLSFFKKCQKLLQRFASGKSSGSSVTMDFFHDNLNLEFVGGITWARADFSFEINLYTLGVLTTEGAWVTHFQWSPVVVLRRVIDLIAELVRRPGDDALRLGCRRCSSSTPLSQLSLPKFTL